MRESSQGYVLSRTDGREFARASVLLVDDQPARLLSYEAILNGLNVRCVRALSGAEALERLLKEEFAVILLDVNMPVMDGFELARLIREHPRFERTPIIFVTAVAVTELDHLKGYEVGAIDYLPVPVVPEILRSKVAVLVELYERCRELKEMNRALFEAREQLAASSPTVDVIRTSHSEGKNSDLLRVPEALSETDRRKDQFLAMLSHELRNPIAPIRTASEALLQLVSHDERQLSLVSMIHRQSAHLTRMLDDLLDFAWLTEGKVELALTVLPVHECIEQAVASVRPLLEAKQHGLAITPIVPPLYFNVDGRRLQQCLFNLLGNAAKFTPARGEIRIHTYAETGQVAIEISDSGVGISPELLPRVFDSFVQFDESLDHSEGGLGLGLSICKLVIELHGGTVTARSTGTGFGSTFTIRLPLIAAPAATATTGASPLKTRVLIVDDNQDAANSLAMLLQLQGYEAKTVYSAESALEQATLFVPQIVLLDIGLPVMDGFEVAARLKTMTPAPRIIAISGYAQADDKRHSLAAGFDVHLLKPVTLEDLTTYLRA